MNDTVNSTKRFPRKFTSVSKSLSTSAFPGTSAPGPTPDVPVTLDAGARDEEVVRTFKTAWHPNKVPAAATGASIHMLLRMSSCMLCTL